MLSRNTIKYIQSLSRKKFRDIHRRFTAETPKVVNEFLNSSYKTETIYGTAGWISKNNNQISHSTTVVTVTDEELNRITQLKKANAVVAILQIPDPNIKMDLKSKITLAIDDIQDPGNMGTIIRIADWFGIENIICNPHTADAFASKVVQSSMGSLARVNVLRTDLLDFLVKTNIPVLAATLNGQSLFSLPPLTEGVILIGNEGKGIEKSLLDYSEKQITIPRFGEAESLNAAVATGIILSHVLKQT